MKAITATLSLAICLTIIFTTTAQAEFITSNNTMLGMPVIDFSTQPTVFNAVGPIQLVNSYGLNIEVTSKANSGLYTNFNGWGFMYNGNWGDGKTYISAFTSTTAADSMIIHFLDGPVSGVGGFMNYAIGAGDLWISALDSSLNVLETYDVTTLADIITPYSVNAGAFRGIQRTSADISYFVINGLAPGLDDLTFIPKQDPNPDPDPVPEPSTLLLLGAGLGGLAIWRRRS
ncbi:PEP-CTERM sorting domain-containing protein [Geobacter grbiciae]|uniref:PEP-CTERM sorting domain-containing protein n=1 Tax=Geobacter grbiciae TaxID=155042 RepID=UPI001C02CA00|nr:PEP-CTERM sorting domain-containing protein [Geobacter grbiciae]MBT1074882.1 PEP-CTERM sorting domain-containing protein [Geobacter grbiciae]